MIVVLIAEYYTCLHYHHFLVQSPAVRMSLLNYSELHEQYAGVYHHVVHQEGGHTSSTSPYCDGCNGYNTV